MQADMQGFALDPRLEADTRPLADLALSSLVLMNDSRWPWVILVPRRPDLVELFDLSEADRTQLVAEGNAVACALKAATDAEKINVAAIGNSVRQFHLHVVARSSGDPNWPRPVWGFQTGIPYGDDAAHALGRRILKELA